MIQDLELLPFYSVARFIEIDFRDLKKSLKTKIHDYKDGITKSSYDSIMKSTEDLYKNIHSTL